MDAKVRYKLYKAGKRWLYSAILFGSTVLTFGISHPINAATPTEEPTSSVQTATVAAPSDETGTTKAPADAQPQQGVGAQPVGDSQAPAQTSEQETATTQPVTTNRAPKSEQAVDSSANQSSIKPDNSQQISTPQAPVVNHTQPSRQEVPEQPAAAAPKTTSTQNQPQAVSTPAQSSPAKTDQSVQPATNSTNVPKAAAAPTATTNSESAEPEADSETPGTKDGEIVVPKEVKKAPDPVNTTSQPTVDPDTRSDVPATNTYPDSIYHQVPVYIGGKLANHLDRTLRLLEPRLVPTLGSFRQVTISILNTPTKRLQWGIITERRPG